MKHIILFVCLFISSIMSYSQDKLILKENSIHVDCEILCISDSNYVFRIGEINHSIAKNQVKDFILSDYYNRIDNLCSKTYVIDSLASSKYKNYENIADLNSNLTLKRKNKERVLTENDLSTQKDLNYYCGLELKRYAKHRRLGMGFSVLGGGLGFLGTNIKANGSSSQDVQLGNMVLFLGVSSALVGTYFVIEAPSHIKNAGLILSGNGVGVKVRF